MKYLSLILLLGMLSACSELEFEEEYPDTNNLTAETMPTSLPVVEVFADQAEFDNMYTNFNRKIVIAGIVRILDENKNVIVDSSSVTMELRGAASLQEAMKTLSFVFDEEINNDSIGLLRPNHVVPGHDLSRLKSIRLRNSGNDFGKTMVFDLSYSIFAASYDLDFELMYGRPVHAFVNGSYFGLLNMRTESSRHGISRLNGADTEELTMMKVDKDNGNLEFEEGDIARANQLTDAIENEDAEAMDQLIDADNFIDYILYQDYVANRDWTVNNARAYSLNGQPFRFILFDLDHAANKAHQDKLPTLEFISDDIGKIYRLMIETAGFEEKLWNRQRELYNLFSVSRFFEIVDSRAAEIENDIPYLISKYGEPANMMIWRMKVDGVKHDFEQRDKWARDKYNLD